MAKRRPPALKMPPVHKPHVVQAALLAPMEQLPAPPVQQDPVQQVQDPVQQMQDPVQPVHVQVQPGQPQLNWSYFKPKFSCKPEEDAETHL